MRPRIATKKPPLRWRCFASRRRRAVDRGRGQGSRGDSAAPRHTRWQHDHSGSGRSLAWRYGDISRLKGIAPVRALVHGPQEIRRSLCILDCKGQVQILRGRAIRARGKDRVVVRFTLLCEWLSPSLRNGTRPRSRHRDRSLLSLPERSASRDRPLTHTLCPRALNSRSGFLSSSAVAGSPAHGPPVTLSF